MRPEVCPTSPPPLGLLSPSHQRGVRLVLPIPRGDPRAACKKLYGKSTHGNSARDSDWGEWRDRTHSSEGEEEEEEEGEEEVGE